MQTQNWRFANWISTLAAMCLGGAALACSNDLPLPSPDEHRAVILAWRVQRIEDLKQPDGWFSFAGRFWLEPGSSSFGGDSSNTVVFPASAPPRIGTFVRDGSRVTMRVEGNLAVTHDGEVVDSLDLSSEDFSERSSASLGSLRWSVMKRADRIAIMVRDSANPAIAEFDSTETYPISLDWVFPARFDRYDPKKTLRLAYAVGGAWEPPSPGAVVFEVNGQTLRLDAIEEDDGETLFIIFGDRTNGEETYGAGRFLRIPAPQHGDRLVIDFNMAENPPCAFSAFTSCPIPPPQNQLPVRIEAGETTYEKSGH